MSTSHDDRGLPRKIGIWLAVVPVIAVGLADATIAVRTLHDKKPVRPVAETVVQPKSAPGFQEQEDNARSSALHALLVQRSIAVLAHDRAGFLATDDPAQPRFRAQQARAFDSMAAVPFAS